MTFALVGGNMALDLANTVQHRVAGPTDLLTEPGDLSRWLVEAGVVDTAVKVRVEEFTTAVRLREAVYRLAAGTATTGDRRLLNRTAKDMPVRVRLGKDGTITRTGDAQAALATVARAAVELLAGDVAGAVKECDADDCTMLYVDNSRRGSRRWCDMRGCGNRAKVATFRARHT
jgi:predicted RNA-binding Zn ribbon-like protein